MNRTYIIIQSGEIRPKGWESLTIQPTYIQTILKDYNKGKSCICGTFIECVGGTCSICRSAYGCVLPIPTESEKIVCFECLSKQS